MKPVLFTAAAVCVAFGVARPSLADRSAQALVFVAICSIIVALVVPFFDGVGASPAAPFVPADPPAPPRSETPDVTEILRAIEGAKGFVPPLLVRQLRSIAVGRLADHHRLGADREVDRTAIEALLSPPMQAITFAGDDRVDTAATDQVPLRALPQLLDELEAL